MRLREVDSSRASSSASLPETDRVTREAASAGTSPSVPQRSDLVQLSGLAARISESLAPLTLNHELRVNSLTQDYHSGNYVVQPLAVGRALIAHSLLGSA
jgi:hypothetical protein